MEEQNLWFTADARVLGHRYNASLLLIKRFLKFLPGQTFKLSSQRFRRILSEGNSLNVFVFL
jgi:hypothetical protein